MAMKITSTQIDHLGLVAGVFDHLGIGEVIDLRLPKLRHHRVTHSNAAKAMILNGLGFVGQRLYLFPEYYEKVPVSRLIGEGIQPVDLNDDVLGSTLDAIYEYGPTELFNEIVLEMMNHEKLGTQLLHADTTSFSVHGEYESDDDEEEEPRSIEITIGHSKDGRMDLNQYVLSMVSNQHGIPLFVRAHSGNSSDKKTILQAIKRVKEGLDLSDDAYFVADSAIYSQENLNHLGQDIAWITRVPATIKEAKALLDTDIEMELCRDNRYSYHITTSSYGGIEQRWVVFQSQPMQQRMEKSFPRMLEKQTRQAQKDLNKLMRREFACEADARKDAELWLAAHPFHKLVDTVIETRSMRSERKRGRPEKGEEMLTAYLIAARLDIEEAAVEKARQKLGRFVLASNDTQIDPNTLLQYYKGQQSVERGFRFLKDKRFRVAEVYLKKEERIEALAMIMVLCLLVYSFAEWLIRKGLKETRQSIPDQKGKPTQKPTLKWIAFIFYGVAEVTVEIGREIHRQIANLKDSMIIVIKILGKDCEKYYGLEA
jgi:transposase